MCVFLFSINLKNGEKVDLNINQVAFNSQPNLNFFSHITLSYTSKGVSFIADISLKNSKLKVLYGKESRINQVAYGNSNEKVFFVESSRNHHESICQYDRSSSNYELLYDSNEDLFQKIKVSRMEKFEINRSSYQIESRIFLPNDIDENRKYPVIIDIHGGPHGRFEDQISISQELFTSNNFIVLAVNPRGSSSYGYDFLNEVLTDWGGEDYLDILDSIDELSKFNFIDLNNDHKISYQEADQVIKIIFQLLELFNFKFKKKII